MNTISIFHCSFCNASSNGIGIPATVSEKDLALSKVLLLIKNLIFLCFNALAIKLAPSPEPINKISFSLMSSKYSYAKLTAIDPTDMLPLFMPVDVLTLLPILIVLSKRIFRFGPENPFFLENSSDLLT